MLSPAPRSLPQEQGIQTRPCCGVKGLLPLLRAQCPRLWAGTAELVLECSPLAWVCKNEAAGPPGDDREWLPRHIPSSDAQVEAGTALSPKQESALRVSEKRTSAPAGPVRRTLTPTDRLGDMSALAVCPGEGDLGAFCSQVCPLVLGCVCPAGSWGL